LVVKYEDTTSRFSILDARFSSSIEFTLTPIFSDFSYRKDDFSLSPPQAGIIMADGAGQESVLT